MRDTLRFLLGDALIEIANCDPTLTVLDWLRRHHRAVQVVSGLFIMAIGVLIFTDAFTRIASLFVFFI